MRMPDRSVIGHVHIEAMGEFDIVMERATLDVARDSRPVGEGIDPALFRVVARDVHRAHHGSIPDFDDCTYPSCRRNLSVLQAGPAAVRPVEREGAE